jgi:hypothetical protein
MILTRYFVSCGGTNSVYRHVPAFYYYNIDMYCLDLPLDIINSYLMTVLLSSLIFIEQKSSLLFLIELSLLSTVHLQLIQNYIQRRIELASTIELASPKLNQSHRG